MIYSCVTIKGVIPNGTLALLVVTDSEGKRLRPLPCEWRMGQQIEDSFIGVEVDIEITDYGTIAALAAPGSLSEEEAEGF